LATKCDLIDEQCISERISKLKSIFGCDFQPVSARTGLGLEQLRDTIDKKLIETALGNGKQGTAGREASLIAITARHSQAVTDAIENVSQALNELEAGNDEVTAMLLRTAYQSISDIKQHIDEQILERIFSRFCIGK
jgi:tRNA U34 5-carboxymethylaminomethyl modifying GTPase MnmE/TrmE